MTTQPLRTPRSPSARAIGQVLAVSCLLTVAMAWPVLEHPTERIFGHEVVGRHHDPFSVMQQLAGAPIGVAHLQPAIDWVGRAFALVMPPVAAYNLLVLVTFPLAAWFAFLLAHAMTASVRAAAFAAFAFAFSPFHLAHAAYHPHVAQVQWVPLYFYTLWHCVRGFTLPRALALVAAGGVAVLANDYHALVLGALTPVALLAFWVAPLADRPRAPRRDLLATAGVLAFATSVAVVALHLIAPTVFSSSTIASRDDLFIYAARWWSYIVPPVTHPVLGPWVAHIWTSNAIVDGVLEQQVFIGWSVGLLCAASLLCWRRRREAAAHVPVLLGLAAVAALCSLSPERTIGSVTWSRPAAWLYDLMPMFRSYARFGVVVQCFASIAAGAAFAALWSMGNGGRVVAMAAIPLLVFEFLPGPPRTRDVLPTSAHRWLQEHSAAQPVFDCTTLSSGDSDVSWLAHRRMGYLDATVPDCAEPSLAPKLRALGYEFLVLRADRLTLPGGELHPMPGFTRVFQGADASVYAIAPSSMTVYIGALDGADVREYARGATWRWAGSRLTMTVVNSSTTASSATLSIALAAFGIPRTVRITLDGVDVRTVRVPVTETAFDIGPLLLGSGRHSLALVSEEPAMSPAAIDGSADARPLAVRVGAWSWRIR